MKLCFERKGVQQTERQKAFTNYYFPVTEQLEKINTQFKLALAVDPNFDIFNPKMSSEISLETRKCIIEEYYADFLTFEGGLEKYRYYTSINNAIDIIRNHAYFMKSILGNEGSYGINKTRADYPLPNYEKIIKFIKKKERSKCPFDLPCKNLIIQ